MATTEKKKAKTKSRNPNRVTRSIWRASTGIEYPIREAPPGATIHLYPNQMDIECAVPGDPTNCALAQFWMRSHDVVDAQIGIDKCYLPTMIDGKIWAVRWMTTAVTRRIIEEFDRTGVMPAEGFWLRGIPPSQSIESIRADKKRFRTRWETIDDKPIKPRKSWPTRNASRRAQVIRVEE